MCVVRQAFIVLLDLMYFEVGLNVTIFTNLRFCPRSFVSHPLFFQWSFFFCFLNPTPALLYLPSLVDHLLLCMIPFSASIFNQSVISHHSFPSSSSSSSSSSFIHPPPPYHIAIHHANVATKHIGVPDCQQFPTYTLAKNSNCDMETFSWWVSTSTTNQIAPFPLNQEEQCCQAFFQAVAVRKEEKLIIKRWKQ